MDFVRSSRFPASEQAHPEGGSGGSHGVVTFSSLARGHERRLRLIARNGPAKNSRRTWRKKYSTEPIERYETIVVFERHAGQLGSET